MSNKFSLKSLFHRKKNKQEDELDRYMKMHAASNSRANQENERPGVKRTGEIAPTACYHTDVAPRSRRGPKSWAAGVQDENMDDGSFMTEVARPRRRAPSPDHIRENKRSSLANRGVAFSEFNGPVSRRRDLDYRTVVINEDNEEGNVDELKSEIRELRRRLAHSMARKSHYKDELANQQDMRRRIDKAYKAQEEKYQMEIKELQEKNDMLTINTQNLQQSLRQRNTVCSQCSMRTPAFYSQYSPFMSMIPQHMPLGSASSIVADPQPTRNDVCQMQMDFNREDKDETKIFTYEAASLADLSEFSLPHSQME